MNPGPWADLVEKIVGVLEREGLWHVLFPTSIGGLLLGIVGLIFYPQQSELLVKITGISALAVVGSGAALWKLRQLRSKLLLRSVFEAEYFWGREDHIAELVKEIEEGAYVWVTGPSGVGKSSMIEKGIVVALKGHASFFPLRVARWGHDWIEGPIQALQLATDAWLKDSGQQQTAERYTADNLKEGLLALKGKFNRTPVVIFDQFDDYLVANRSEFVSRTGKVITGRVLHNRNPFWKAIAELNASEEVRCVFVTRSDIQWGRDSVRFRDLTGEFEVQRLERSVLADFLQIQTKSEVIANAAQGGWEGLRERLVTDLSMEGGLLPIQTRLALSGLGELKHLTLDDYLDAGGVDGLIAKRVDDLIRRACEATSNGLDIDQLRKVLLELVDVEETKTLERSASVLLGMLPEGQVFADPLQRALDFLAKHDIVREVSTGPSPERLWRLDHDYLCRPLLRLEEQRNPFLHKLDAAFRAYNDAAGVWKKFNTLLSPTPLFRILLKVVQGKFRLGSKRNFAALSLVKLVLSPVLLLALAGGWFLWDLRINREAQEIVNGLGVAPFETGLWALRNARFATRRRVVDNLLSDSNLAARIETSNVEIVKVTMLEVAFSGKAERDAIVQSSISGPCYNLVSQIYSPQLSLCATFAVAVDSDASRAASFLVAAMKQKDRTVRELRTLARGLALLGTKVAEEKTSEAATVLVYAMKEKDRSLFELAALANSLGSLTGKVPEEKAGDVSVFLAEAMKMKGRTVEEMQSLARGLASLGGEVAEKQAGICVSVLLRAMQEKGRSANELFVLAEGLRLLEWRIEQGQAAEGANVLVKAMNEKGRSLGELQALTIGLRSLTWNLGEEKAGQLSNVLVESMKQKGRRGRELEAMASGLGSLRGKVAEDKAGEGAGVLVQTMKESGRSVDELAALARGLGVLGGKVAEGRASEGASVLVASMKEKGRGIGELQTLAGGLGSLGPKIAKEKASQGAALLVASMKEKGRTVDELSGLASALGPLGGNVKEEQAGVLGRVLLDAMNEKKRGAGELSQLARGLGALAISMPRSVASSAIRELVPILEVLRGIDSCEGLQALAKDPNVLSVNWLVELIGAPSCFSRHLALQQLSELTSQNFTKVTEKHGLMMIEPDWWRYHEWIDSRYGGWTILPTGCRGSASRTKSYQ